MTLNSVSSIYDKNLTVHVDQEKNTNHHLDNSLLECMSIFGGDIVVGKTYFAFYYRQESIQLSTSYRNKSANT